MSLDYNSIAGNVYNALLAHNTTTASPDLSSSMTTRVLDDSIIKADPEVVGIRNYQFPQIFIRVNNKSEEYGSLGETGPTGNKKLADVTFDVIAFVKKEGAYSNNESLLKEIYTLAKNIEGVFQKEMTLSNTALWCNPSRTDFIGPANIDGIWVRGATIELNARYLFR